ncbi:peptidylprolyl isomerase [Flammeovirga pectinis]|nr:peptidylprolyl isomerase [Flammeovirga pectinis]
MSKLNYSFKLNFLLVFICVFTSACTQDENLNEEKIIHFDNKFKDSKIRDIYNLRDQRNTLGVAEYLTSDSLKYRREALIAFGSIQDTTALPYCKKILEEENNISLKIAAAFAIGQISSPVLNDFLINYIVMHEADEEVVEHLFEALGMCATDRVIVFMTGFVTLSVPIKRGIVKGLYKAIIWQKSTSLDAALQVMRIYSRSFSEGMEDDETREWCSSFFGKLNSEHTLEVFSSNIFDQARRNEDELIRANFALAIKAFSKANGSATALQKILSTEKSPLVLINAIRSTEAVKYTTVIDETISFLANENPIVATVAADVLYRKLGWNTSKKVYKIAKGIKYPNPRAKALKAVMEERNKQSEIYNFAKDLFDNSSSVYEKCLLLEAMNESKIGKNIAFDTWKTTTSTPLKTKAIEIITANYAKHKSLSSAKGKELNKILVDALLTNDVGQIYTICSFMSSNVAKFKKYYPSVNQMDSVKNNLEIPLQVEAVIEIEKAIAAINKTPYKYSAPKSNVGVKWEMIQHIKENHLAKIYTNQGEITIQLKVEEAPATVAMFVDLVQQNFYDGLFFHRMVPNFVAQGGDPRGDGFGGLPYSIPSEFSLLEYKEGSLGIASAGKDTESCQFFFTEVPTHHLDGRYTVFAEVVEGLDVMHKLEYGDKMDSVVVVKDILASAQ